MTIYIFFRFAGWYPVDLRDDDDARRNAEGNLGTIRVEDKNGRVVWEVARTEGTVKTPRNQQAGEVASSDGNPMDRGLQE